jgi:hypothetical protein
MKPEKQKDAMSELVDILATSDTQDTSSASEGVVTTPDGDKVTLGIDEVAKLVLKSAREKVAIQKYLTRKAVEKHLKQPPRKGG